MLLAKTPGIGVGIAKKRLDLSIFVLVGVWSGKTISVFVWVSLAVSVLLYRSNPSWLKNENKKYMFILHDIKLCDFHHQPITFLFLAGGFT